MGSGLVSTFAHVFNGGLNFLKPESVLNAKVVLTEHLENFGRELFYEN